ncbi:hypothetical protein DSS3PM1_00072 [Bacteriophage DSS3_PM1]|nr:hypothetical protein DSS3PM1_00072 [Bacteriophage DSS3_PM1]
MNFAIRHPQIQNLIDLAMAYGAGDKKILELQLDIVRRSCMMECEPHANLIVLPGCELGYMEGIPSVLQKYQENIRYADAVVLDQGGLWYVIKDRFAGRHGPISDDYFRRLFVRECNNALRQRQELWREKTQKK